MKRFIAILILILVFLYACKEKTILSTDKQVSQAKVTVTGLLDLSSEYTYGVWAVYDSSKIPLTVYLGSLESAGGNQVQKAFPSKLGVLQHAHSILISIEQADSVGEDPSAYRILSARLSEDQVANVGSFDIMKILRLEYSFRQMEIPVDTVYDKSVSDLKGVYVMATPTDPEGNNQTSGIWFTRLDTAITIETDDNGNETARDTSVTRVRGLDLPDLPSGWTYKAMVLSGGDTLQIGGFTKAGAADNSSLYGSGGSGFAFPGEDFLTNAPAEFTFPADLSGTRVEVHLIPPIPEKNEIPYKLVPFSVQIPANPIPMKNYMMENQTDQFPQGDLAVEVELYE